MSSSEFVPNINQYLSKIYITVFVLNKIGFCPNVKIRIGDEYPEQIRGYYSLRDCSFRELGMSLKVYKYQCVLCST